MSQKKLYRDVNQISIHTWIENEWQSVSLRSSLLFLSFSSPLTPD